MKTVFRFLVIATGLTLILLSLGLILLSTQAGAAADLAVERGLEYVYQTKVSVDRVAFLPRESSLVLYEVTISNPEPFKPGTAMQFAEVRVRMDPSTVLGRNPTVEEIVLSGGRFNVRYETGRGTNLGKLNENASRLKSSGQSGGGTVLLTRDYTVTEFRSEKAQLQVSANFVPGNGLSLTLAPFDVQGLNESAPVSTARICTLLIRSVFREALTLRGLIPPVADKLNDELQRLREQDGAE